MSQTPVLPNVFIAGVSKCGTTSLISVLSKHPQIAISSPKEPCLFALEDVSMNPHPFFENSRVMLAELESLDYRSVISSHSSKAFSGEPNSVRVDGTPGYFVSQLARQRIREIVPDAKIVLILRDPTQRLLSSYWHDVRHGRAVSRFTPWLRTDGLRHLESGMYFDHLTEWYRDFPAENIFVCTSQQFKLEREEVLRRIFRHIGVGEDTYDYAERHELKNVTPYPRILSARLAVNRVSMSFSSARQTTALFSDSARSLTTRQTIDRYVYALSSRLGKLLESSSQREPHLDARDTATLNNVKRLYRIRNRGLNELLGWDVEGQW